MTIEATLIQAESRAENVHFLCGLTRRRYDCLLRNAKQLRIKIMGRGRSNE